MGTVSFIASLERDDWGSAPVPPRRRNRSSPSAHRKKPPDAWPPRGPTPKRGKRVLRKKKSRESRKSTCAPVIAQKRNAGARESPARSAASEGGRPEATLRARKAPWCLRKLLPPPRGAWGSLPYRLPLANGPRRGSGDGPLGGQASGGF